jgi:hypothetical protein
VLNERGVTRAANLTITPGTVGRMRGPEGEPSRRGRSKAGAVARAGQAAGALLQGPDSRVPARPLGRSWWLACTALGAGDSPAAIRPRLLPASNIAIIDDRVR